ncbi:MAG: polyprenyl synthetase family protein [Bryobacterales bacterium]|nr:polyprenyl synthetase family protein [Bryobacterales bacterium]
MSTTVLPDLEIDRKQVEQYLDELLARRSGEGSAVLDAMRYSVLGPGQRLRPLLAYRVARMLDAECPEVTRAAAAVELLHCASLIVDDLPCMDNSTIRRDRPCTHLVFGESTALLSAFAMVALSARSLIDGGHSGWQMERLVRFQGKLLRTMDCSSLIGGQDLDLKLSGAAKDVERDKISDLKTVPLFQLAVAAGAAFANVDESQKQNLKALGREFGLAYQMADDYIDGEENNPAALRRQFDRTREIVRSFGPRGKTLEDLLDYLDGKAFGTRS